MRHSRFINPNGFSLVELLIVIAILAIMVGYILPSATSIPRDQVESAAHMLASDLSFARSLAVTNNSNYRVTFELANNQYVLTHSGTDATLDSSIMPPFTDTGPTNQYVVALDDQAYLSLPVTLERVFFLDGSNTSTNHVEFGPLGETTQSSPVCIQLTAGPDESPRTMYVTVNPATGLSSVRDTPTTVSTSGN